MEKADRKQREDFAMTETKYIFPKQMQSVAALAFIAVLIVLLLILTVMVHMRNRKLKSTLEEQIAERRLLDKICADFTAVYYVELNTGFFSLFFIQILNCILVSSIIKIITLFQIHFFCIGSVIHMQNLKETGI